MNLIAAIALVFAVAVPARAQPATTLIVDSVERCDWSLAAARIDAGDEVNLAQPDGMTALHWAVYREHVDIAARLIDAGADVNAKTLYDVTPLSIACTSGNTEIAKRLLDAGADANATLPGGETALMTAARTGSVNVVRALIDHGAKVEATEINGQTALMWAAAEGNAEVVDHLINSGADVRRTLKSGFSPLMFAAREGRIDAVNRLLQAGADIDAVMEPADTGGRAPRRGMSALMLAVESGHFELAMTLIKQGADPNDQRSGFTPLHALTWVRKTNFGDDIDGDPPPRGSGSLTSLQFVRELVAAGADVNMQLKQGSAAGKAKLNMHGATPFLLAAKTADVPLLKLLLELGADPHLTNVDGCTPLMAAAGVGVTAVGEEAGTEAEVLEAIKLLISLGADANVVDRNGETAMHGAAYRCYPAAVALLVENGADPHIWNRKNKHGWTPTLIAAGNRPGSFKPSPETIAALEAALSANAKR